MAAKSSGISIAYFISPGSFHDRQYGAAHRSMPLPYRQRGSLAQYAVKLIRSWKYETDSRASTPCSGTQEREGLVMSCRLIMFWPEMR